MNNQHQQHQQLKEGLEYGDLKRLIHPELHIDEYKSKLGRDEDVAVLSFKLATKEPAEDLVSFCEKGYEWVIDADVSSGELDDGAYLVFVELERDYDLPKHVHKLLQDMMNLTEQSIEDWRVRYRSDETDHEATVNSIADLVPLSAKSYNERYGKEDIDKMKAAAGVEVTTKAPKNDFTESLRIAAGIR
jgi:hypothetical protein